MKKKEIHLQVLSISHGLSELCISKSIKSNLRIKHGLEAENKGKESVQVTSLLTFLNKHHLRTMRDFLTRYPDVESEKQHLKNFCIFPIMDLDDCTEEQQKKYIDGTMFRKHWLKPYIVPIYNRPNLEVVMQQAEIPVIKKKDYIRIFPTNHGDLDMEMAKDFCERLKKVPNTNMERYVEYCIQIALAQRISP